MAVGKDKQRITISLEKELIKYIKERAEKNRRTISKEIAYMFEQAKINEENQE